MLIRITSARCEGIEASPVTVEVNISNGIGIHLVGLADAAVKESLLRTVTALQSLKFRIPGKKIVINLAPADIHKKGSCYDLPIALGIIAASGQREMPGLGKYVIMGELGLDGTVRDIPGALPVSEAARQWGFEGCILPMGSACETIDFGTDCIFGVNNLDEVLEIVCETEGFEKYLIRPGKAKEDESVEKRLPSGVMDFSEIAGQEAAKRGLEIAAAGGHNIILVGAAGSGKSSLAKAMCTILPPMSREEALQTSKIYSVAGSGSLRADIRTRPFRSPHNTASIASLVGGGQGSICPGEISLAHNGILFMDEFCEIPRACIEALRGPLEDKRIVISRLRSRVELPADFTLVAATNPCPCGYYGEGDRCSCSVGQRMAYLSKLSGPIMDRIDIHVWCNSLSPKELMSHKAQESSAEVAKRVANARSIQTERFKDENIFCNSQMDNRLLDKFCPLDEECKSYIEKAMEKMGLSARACKRIIKLARTIADLESAPVISVPHLAEAVSYRFLDKKTL